MNISRTLLLSLLAILAAGCSTTSTRFHPNLENELKQINSVVIAPPDVEVQLVTLTGENERLSGEELEIKSELVRLARRKLDERGYVVVDHDFDSQIEKDSEFAYLVNQIRSGFEQAKKDLRSGVQLKPEEAKRIKSSVGTAVNAVAEASGADAILLIRYQGFQKSDGHIAKDIGTSVLVGILTAGAVVPISKTSSALTEVALVDGVTGDVIWTDVHQGTLTPDITAMAMVTMPTDIDNAGDAPFTSIAEQLKKEEEQAKIEAKARAEIEDANKPPRKVIFTP